MIPTSIVVTVLLGIAASVFTEVATAINKLLTNTVLKGDGAFLLSFAMAFLAAIVKEVLVPGFTFATLLDIHQLGLFFAETFSVSEVFFLVIYQRLGLDINSLGVVAGPVTVPATVVAPAAPAASV